MERAAEEGIEILPSYRPSVMWTSGRGKKDPRTSLCDHGERSKNLDLANGTVLKEQLVDTKTAGQILDILGKYDTLREIYYDGTGYAQREQRTGFEDFFSGKVRWQNMSVLPGARWKNDGKISYREPGGRTRCREYLQTGREKESVEEIES